MPNFIIANLLSPNKAQEDVIFTQEGGLKELEKQRQEKRDYNNDHR